MGTVSYLVRADGGPEDGVKALIKAMLSTHDCTKVRSGIGKGRSSVNLQTGTCKQQAGFVLVHAD
jgi:hypothetical protein